MITKNILVNASWISLAEFKVSGGAFVREMRGEQLSANTLLFAILAFSVALIPPLYIRGTIGKPLRKMAAILIVGFFVIVNNFIYIALGGQGKGGFAIALIAFVSYHILHRGYDRDFKQTKEWIERTEYSLVKEDEEGKCVYLRYGSSNKCEKWAQNQYKAKYVLIVNEKEYEFSCKVRNP